MAAEIRKAFGTDPEMIEGSGGVFDVRVDGELIFSKHEVGRFPEHREVLEKLRARAK